ncbi:hypothetical protein KP509_17G078400 [Ceratopteris richardii]|uniref:Knottins-like domain-containing protein n=2 Tax=Ceratopteris richardii TaxID=49495 RepID=A0A8T2SXM6_CERRI|nr:hypothetical protein KP509_17G078400 [Ceratopteris richardii]
MASILRCTALFLLLVLLFVMTAPQSLEAARENPEGTRDSTGLRGLSEKNPEENEEVVMPEGLCRYSSKTFSGVCVSSRSCAYQCTSVEHAAAGACHVHHVTRHCYCYRHC